MRRHVLEYLENAAAVWSEAPAFSDESGTLSYAGLRERARSVAAALGWDCLRCPVAVLCRRDLLSLEAMFGALYAGGFYVPLDAEMPPARLSGILERLKPAALLYAERDAALAEEYPGRRLPIEAARETPPELAEPWRGLCDLDPAYVIFTSGSTGQPKGIVVAQRSVIDFTEWYAELLGCQHTDVLGNQAPFFFDLSVKDLYLSLKCGAHCVLLPKKCFSFPLLLTRELNARGVTILSWATSAFHLVAASGILEKDPPRSVRRVTAGGEAMQARLLRRWQTALPEARIFNLYGPTEATVDCCYHEITRAYADGEPVPVGRACANMEVLLLDEGLDPVPRGEKGELCVRGTGLALGYYGDPERSERAFVQNPRTPAYRDLLYRTGDLAYENEEGLLVFCARADDQIKHNGYRIELGEIERAVYGVAFVREAVCFFDAARDQIVCLYDGDGGPKELIAALRRSLPKYMLPNVCKQTAIAHMPNGKPDRRGMREAYLHGA